MKSLWNSITFIVIGLLFVLGYVIPSAVTKWEDQSLASKTKAFEIDEISLNSNEVDIAEKLSAFQELLAYDMVLHDAEIEADDSRVDEVARQNVEAFIKMLNEEYMPIFERFFVSSMVTADVEGDSVYQLWRCIVIDSAGYAYVFWLDAATEKVMAFEVTLEAIPLTSKNSSLITKTLAEYYGFSTYELLGNISTIEKEKSWKGELHFFNPEEGSEIYLPIYKDKYRVTFNMYPGTTAISDLVESLY